MVGILPVGVLRIDSGPNHWLALNAIKDRFHVKTALVVAPNDQGGTDPGNALLKLFNKDGVSTTIEFYQRGTTNFEPIVGRIMGQDLDLVEIGPMPPGEGGLL